MRATKAYIASLGTTGLLLAFSASLLVVVGTLFAFNAWPGGDIREAVGGLVVEDDDSLQLSGPAQVARDASPAALAVASKPVVTTAGNTGARGLGGGSTGGDGRGRDGGGGGAFENGDDGGSGGGPVPPGGGDPADLDDEIDTAGPTDGVADATEDATNRLGDAVHEVSPELGDAVSGTGQSLSGIVRGLPDVQAGKNGIRVDG